MGLDFVELMLSIEDRYGIDICEGDVKEMDTTFGGLVELVKRKIEEPFHFEPHDTNEKTILTTLVTQLRPLYPDGTVIDEKTPLKTFASYAKRRNVWLEVKRCFPELYSWDATIRDCKPFYLKGSNYAVFGLLLFIWFIGYFSMQENTNFFWYLRIIFSFIMCIGLAVWLFFTVRYKKIGDIVHEIVKKRKTRIQSKTFSTTNLENELRTMISEQFCIKPEKIRLESDLFNDLQLG